MASGHTTAFGNAVQVDVIIPVVEIIDLVRVAQHRLRRQRFRERQGAAGLQRSSEEAQVVRIVLEIIVVGVSRTVVGGTGVPQTGRGIERAGVLQHIVASTLHVRQIVAVVHDDERGVLSVHVSSEPQEQEAQNNQTTEIKFCYIHIVSIFSLINYRLLH